MTHTSVPSWDQLPWLGFDTETTGVNPHTDRLVTAALVLREGGAAAATGSDVITTWLADPEVDIPDSAAQIHGITTQMALNQGRPIREVLEELAASLASHMGHGYPVVAFNGSFDFTLLEEELSRHGLPTLAERLGLSEPAPIIDPLVLDRHLDRYRKGKKQLSLMASAYGVPVSENAHTAEYDVVMTLDVLAAIARKFPDCAAQSCAQIHAFQKEAHAAWAENFESFLRSRGRDTHIDREWPQITPRGRSDDQE